MALVNVSPTLSSRMPFRLHGPHLALAIALSLTTGAFVLSRNLLSADLVLPLVASLLFGLALITALWRFTRGGETTRRLSYWDVAGLLTFIAICVAALVEPDQMLRLIQGSGRPS